MTKENQPQVKVGQWIDIYGNIDGYVFSISSDGSLQVGYFQHRLKAIKEEVIWDGTNWAFKFSGPNGSYLRGRDAEIVKRGPQY